MKENYEMLKVRKKFGILDMCLDSYVIGLKSVERLSFLVRFHFDSAEKELSLKFEFKFWMIFAISTNW